MGSIQKKDLKCGVRYYIVFKIPSGQWRWEGGFRLKKDAEKRLQARESEIAAGIYGKLEEITFQDFAKLWLEDYASLNVRARTLDDYSQVVRVHLLPFFGTMPLSSITPGKVQEYLAGKIRSGLSPRTVEKTLTVLKMMFKQGEICGYLSDNPGRFVQAPRKEHREMDFLNPEEIRRLLDATSPEYYPLFATAIFTGARQGELIGLQWGDIDFDRALIFIRRTFDQKHGYGPPKSAMGRRTINMTQELISILKEHKAEQAFAQSDGLVFPNRAGNPISCQNMVTREFYPALDRAGLRRVRFHDLRHTFASLLVHLGASPKYIQAQLGHGSISVTMDVYAHLLPETAAGVTEQFDDLVFSRNVLPLPKREEPENLSSAKSI